MKKVKVYLYYVRYFSPWKEILLRDDFWAKSEAEIRRMIYGNVMSIDNVYDDDGNKIFKWSRRVNIDE